VEHYREPSPSTTTSPLKHQINPPFLWKCLCQVRVITVFPVFWLLTDLVCLYTYEFWLSLCNIVRSTVILLLQDQAKRTRLKTVDELRSSVKISSYCFTSATWLFYLKSTLLSQW
jgi:hypothetical protein